jgi:iron(III) transport system substrate-binding protein
MAAGLLLATPAGAKTKPVPLVVYSSQGYGPVVVHAFETKTGISVRLVTKPLGSLASTIQATQGNPKWDVLWTDGPTELAALDKQNMLVQHLKPAVALNTLGKLLVPKDKSFVPTGVTFTAALLYTKTAVPFPPRTWSDLLKPTWTGQVGMTTPKKVAATYPFIAGRIAQAGGAKKVSKGEAYFTKLKANGLKVYPTTGALIQAVAKGHIKLALVQSSVAVGATHLATNLAVSYLPTVTVLPSAIGIDAKAPSNVQAEAKKFMNYVLSQPGQNAMQAGTRYNESNYYPVVNNVLPLDLTKITPYVWAKRQAAVTAWFVKHITH